MTFEAYLSYFNSILSNPNPPAPYDKADYMDYCKLNWSRMHRWLKKGTLSEGLVRALLDIDRPQQWIVITEPWCGDAAHSVPFLHMMALQNPLIRIDYELRDAEPYRIQQYLTNGGKSIPKLIIRDESGADLATWGPRPAPCQVIYQELVASKADFETVKTSLQLWYNEDKGHTLQKEMLQLITA